MATNDPKRPMSAVTNFSSGTLQIPFFGNQVVKMEITYFASRHKRNIFGPFCRAPSQTFHRGAEACAYLVYQFGRTLRRAYSDNKFG